MKLFRRIGRIQSTALLISWMFPCWLCWKQWNAGRNEQLEDPTHEKLEDANLVGHDDVVLQ